MEPLAAPDVSVCMVAYQHGPFIAKAIESALAQSYAGEMELVIRDDGSTDATRAVAEAFAARHPDRIRLLPTERRLGPARNFDRILTACRGTWVAILDADDYWTDTEKLAVQTQLLQGDATTVAAFHRCRIESDAADAPPREWPDLELPRLGVEELIDYNPIPTSSIVFRRAAVPRLQDWYLELAVGDWPLWLMLARSGEFAFLPRVMSTYRVHEGGAWSRLKSRERLEGTIEMFERMRPVLGAAYAREIETKLSMLNYWLGLELAAAGDKRGVRRCLVECFRNSRLWQHAPAKLELLVRSC